jgi:hypothetical protein
MKILITLHGSVVQEELTDAHIFKKFPAVVVTRRYIYRFAHMYRVKILVSPA